MISLLSLVVQGGRVMFQGGKVQSPFEDVATEVWSQVTACASWEDALLPAPLPGGRAAGQPAGSHC